MSAEIHEGTTDSIVESAGHLRCNNLATLIHLEGAQPVVPVTARPPLLQLFLVQLPGQQPAQARKELCGWIGLGVQWG